MIYGYCIRGAKDPAPGAGLRGIDEAAVDLHTHASLGLWISTVEGPVSPTEERLRMHERVVREALQTATPLPLRFGTVFDSEVSVDLALAERAESFENSLERVRGLVEMGIRVERADGPPPPAGVSAADVSSTGRAFLERRRTEIEAGAVARADAARTLDEIENDMRGLAVETTCTISVRNSLLGRVACLVHRADVPTFRAHITDVLRASRPDLRFAISGPWAPYSFANE